MVTYMSREYFETTTNKKECLIWLAFRKSKYFCYANKLVLLCKHKSEKDFNGLAFLYQKKEQTKIQSIEQAYRNVVKTKFPIEKQ